ncbi:MULTISPECIES: hypothetical protein [unclassified Mesorhizobium]|uniref:hypothetical protein n=1 Tax=unclassified Mesorhizobium TaxID=325217 RepID=UPI001126828E|nr:MULTISPECIES: hypothetical protein [unclassified Mesorhizobium]TPK89834.1 hypothetical protein FJ567_30070 [Mesorhizobium sp. B2-4-16]TPL57359.1 hypothetical protein FJ956_30235 [Mesorhizobium sp. B2-4-3]
MIAKFCQERGLKHQTRHVQAIWPNGKYETYRLYCFRDAASAQAFLDHFEGLMFDPRRDRGTPPARAALREHGPVARLRS